MRKKRPDFPWSKYLSGFLVFLLLVSQTIRVDFFDVALASPEDYRDIVSILVDKDTYSTNRTEVLRYAKDIEGYLGGTRTSLFVVDADTPPAIIAAKNERLYNEGDGGDGVSHLVGTVLIGNIPIPMVNLSGKYFPSLYPYVDFVDKQFVYNERSFQYESTPNANRDSIEPEVWHGVINPAVGRKWDNATDVQKIKDFLDKTHDFYTKSGKFTPDTIPQRVFYYDGFYESKSVNLKKIFQYGLSMQNSENLAYKRFTKYLLKDVNAAILAFDKTNNKETDSTLSDLGLSPGSDVLDDTTIDKMPDIQTETPIRSILTNFKGVFNEKTLSDALLFIHNAGRYNSGSTIRADVAPITMTLMDEMARSTLKEANATIQNIIDQTLTTQKIAKRIPIFDHIETSYGVPVPSATGSLDIYDNYFFGEKSANLKEPAQCTLARGSNKAVEDFGRDVLVEANVGYDVMSVSSQANLLKNDTQELVGIYKSSAYSCFTPAGQAKLQSYWGGNSLLRATNSSNPSDILQEVPGGTNLTGFSLPIFSLGGMKETTRFAPASVQDCIDTDYQYGLRPPYQVSDGSCSVIYPTEWSTSPIKVCGSPRAGHPPRFTCITSHDTLQGIPNFAQSLVDYSSKTCFAGDITMDGKVVNNAARNCYLDEFGVTTSYIPFTSTGYTDITTYENQVFHTIPSILRHISPTSDEISAAKSNQVTPSLPVDTIQYVEFLTPKGNVAQLHYPNFFTTPGTDVPTVRAWLKTVAQNDWNAIIAKENATSLSAAQNNANAYLAAGSVPSAPIDWNDYVSDEFIEKVLQAKNWLNPDAIEKYRKTVETTLSYSHRYSGNLYDSPPILPTLTDSYEIAYLGLSGLTPSSTEDSGGDYASIASDYNLQLANIQGLNISDPYDSSDNNPSKEADACGPPEGVNLFQWPQAIMCWIKAQMPPKILAGSCGSTTIGSSASSSSSSMISPTAVMNSSGELMKSFYAGGDITYSVPRVNMGLYDTLEAQVEYKKGGVPVNLPLGTEVALSIVRSPSQDVLTVAPNITQATDSVAKFVVNSAGNKGDVTLQATMKIPLPDGGYYTVVGTPLDIHVSDEYLDVNTRDGTTQHDVTSGSGVVFDFAVKNGSGDIFPVIFPLKLDITDDVEGIFIATGITVNSADYTLPEKFSKKVGVYKLTFSDKQNRTGDITLSVRSGILQQVNIAPLSSTIVRGAKTLAMIELKDSLGNLISPGLHSIDIKVNGGYLLDNAGQKKESMHIDAMEPQIPLSIGSDVAGSLGIEVVVDSDKKTQTTIQIINAANFALNISGTPKVGGDSIPVTFRLTDKKGNILSGFNSVATLTLPNDAGYFTPDAIPVKAGIASFDYTPGTYAGEHVLTVDIPGINTITGQKFVLQAGDPMYITHKQEGGNLVFSIRDRYGNHVTGDFTGSISRNSETPVTVPFSQGEYSMPARSGYYIVKVPSLASSVITYTESDGTHTIAGIPHYATYIDGVSQGFDFLPDYNARYTILAGGSFLREGEDILFNTLPGSGQSLAVSTLLDSPYSDTTVFSIVPGGGFSLGAGVSDSPEAQITIENGFPVLGVINNTDHSRVARVIYRMNNATFDVCSYSGSAASGSEKCLASIKDNTIRFALNADNPGYAVRESGGSMILENNNTPVVTIASDGSISPVSGVRFVPNSRDSHGSLVMDVMLGNTTLAKLAYTTDRNISVEKTPTPFAPVNHSTPLLDGTSTVTSSEFSQISFGSDVVGYRFAKSSTTRVIDEEKNGPSTMDSLALTPEKPGVGWQANNTMMLSYAAGDIVGDATKWFHTYTLVNLGDPVAHIDEHKVGTEQEGIDRSIGTRITSPNTKDISSVTHHDMDADGYEDIITLHNDGYLDLLLNQRGKFRFREKIAYAPSLVSRGITLGDFTHDNYADIIGVNSSGSFIYIDNSSRKFAQMSIGIPVTSGGAPTGVTQFKVYDMDADGRDDVVYLTEGGELGVLYGTTNPGIFDKKIVDANLGVSLDSIPSSLGGAIKLDFVPQFPSGSLGVSPTTNTGVDAAQLQGNIYYQFPRVITPTDSGALDMSTASNLSAIESSIGGLTDASSSVVASPVDTYIQSQYAPAYGIEINKTFQNISSSTIHSDDQIEVTISLYNSGTTTAKNITYLDTIPTIFSAEKTMKYQVILDGQVISRDFQYLDGTDYDAYFVGRDIPAGHTLQIKYQLTALPASYGDMLVGDFEQGETGADAYGDIGFQTSTTCGADMLLWRSGPASRDYAKGSRTFTQAQLPSGIASQLTDADNNGIPDSMDTTDANGDGVPDSPSLSLANRQNMLDQLTTKQAGGSSKPLVSATLDTSSNKFTLGFDSSATADVMAMGDNLMSGLQCGFGGSSCMSFPLNWAPLAPGSDPPTLGMPGGDGLKVDEGLPLFSALTEIAIGPIYGVCYEYPSVWPVSPLVNESNNSCTADYIKSWGNAASVIGSMGKKSPTSDLGAGGMLGIEGKSNFLRIFVTPTLTMGMGAAICFGGPASKVGKAPGLGLSPLVQGGNCIVITDTMPVCKGDGSSGDGDVRGISGLGSMTDAWNAGSCSLEANTSNTLTADEKNWTNDVIAYLKNPNTTRLNSIYSRMQSNPGNTKNLGGPLLRIGGGGANAGTSVEVGLDSSKPFSLGNIVKVKNKRISGFPDFVMDWVQRQGDEIVKALFTIPHITLYAPTTLGQHAQFDGSFQNFLSRFSEASATQGVQNLQTQMGNAYNNTNAAASLSNNVGNTNSSAGSSFAGLQQQFIASNSSSINTAAGGLNAMRAAYKFIGKLPFITISSRTVPINVPWILPSELDKYERALSGYQKELNRAADNFCVNKTATECANAKASLNSGGFMSSINQNLKRIKEYKDFPIKLQKYVTWKQRYMSQILCNVNTIAQLTGGWIKDNGIRFRKWVELYVLVKAIADSWQPILDLFYDTSAQCGVCRNQRYDLTYWKFKLISSVIPSIPIIKFPRWPNIVLDLSDVQLGINVTVPEFQFKMTPIKLPSIPNLSLPNFGAGLSLPNFPLLPAIPTLPDLPSLPSFPKLSLPNLPPPPKLPKIMSSLSGILKIFKLISKMYCWYNSTFLISEDQVGSVIADRTERQGTMSLDFLSLMFPNISTQTLREIRVSSHVNFNLRTDFITEFARSAVKPINSFTTDISRGLPNKVGQDVNIQSQKVNVKLQTNTGKNDLLALLKNEIAVFMSENSGSLDVEDSKKYLIAEIQNAGLPAGLVLELQNMIADAAAEQEATTKNLLAYNDARFESIRKFIQAEYDETAELQSVVDSLQKREKLLVSTGDQYLMVSDQIGKRSAALLDTYNRDYVVGSNSPENIQESAGGLSESVTNLQSKISRLAALSGNSSASSSSSSSNSVASGYSPSFNGIYVLTPSGIQTRLFDYMDELTGQEKVQVVDIDKDGDMDYLYLMDGVVYIKYTHTNAPVKIQDTTVRVETLTKNDELPTSPNFFHESINTPGSLSVSFSPASPNETTWRMEFFSRYLEWDTLDAGNHTEAVTPRSIIDLQNSEAKENIVTNSNSAIQSVNVSRYLSRVFDKNTFIMSGPQIRILTGTTQFTVSPGKMIYTGDQKAKILYHTGANSDTFLSLEAHTGYRFTDLVYATLQSGKIYAVTSPFAQETYAYSDDFIGMPILPRMKFTSSSGGFEVRTTDGVVTSLAPGANYMLLDVGNPDSEYSFSVDYQNGYYSARLRNLDTKNGVMTTPILLAPQASSDRSPPIVDIPELIRIPVYTSKTYKLSDYITERNKYSVKVDPDISVDADGNGLTNDDFSSIGGSGVTLLSGSLSIGSFDIIGNRTAQMQVVDEFNNMTESAINIQVYAPVPQISATTQSGWVLGKLNESLLHEPVYVFRVRSGTGIAQVNTTSLMTGNDGIFSGGSYLGQSGTVLNLGGQNITLSDRGLFHFPLPPGISIAVSAASQTTPMTIKLLSASGVLYSQSLILPTGAKVLDGISGGNTSTGNLVVTTSSGGYLFIAASLSDPVIPGGGYIVDSNHKPLVAIAQDGNIYTLATGVTLGYGQKDGYLLIGIKKDGTEFATAWYTFDLFYTLK